MNKKQLIKSLLENVFCRISLSKIHGVGVVAIKRIPKGTLPFGPQNSEKYLLVRRSELKGINANVMEMVESFCYEDKKKGFYIPAQGITNIDISFFMNDSQSPNIDVKTFAALRDISPGEELTIDYDNFE